MRSFFTILAVGGLISLVSCAPESRVDDGLIYGDPVIEEVAVDPAFLESLDFPTEYYGSSCNNNKDIGLEDIPIAEIVNTAQEIWIIVEKNKPVVNLSHAYANALPQGIDNWLDMANWQKPKAREFRVSYKNLYGINVVDFTFRLLYTAGGQVQGKGHYLSKVTVLPARLDVAWAYKFEAETVIEDVMNIGSEKDPEAAMRVLVKWQINTPLKHSQHSTSFGVYGKGDYEILQ
jgi:hypothetical protein